MFKNEYDIGIDLICPKCSHLYKDAQILPCGQTLCKQCIEMTISSGEISKCWYCQSKHILPANGFTKNDVVEKILNKRAQNGLNLKLYEMSIKEIVRDENEKANRKSEIENVKEDSRGFLNEVKDIIDNGLWDEDEEKNKWKNCMTDMEKFLVNNFDYCAIKSEKKEKSDAKVKKWIKTLRKNGVQ